MQAKRSVLQVEVRQRKLRRAKLLTPRLILAPPNRCHKRHPIVRMQRPYIRVRSELAARKTTHHLNGVPPREPRLHRKPEGKGRISAMRRDHGNLHDPLSCPGSTSGLRASAAHAHRPHSTAPGKPQSASAGHREQLQAKGAVH